MGEFNKVTYLYGWCQKIIPLVYDDSLTYYENLCKVLEKLNEVITNTNMIPDMIRQEVQDFINSGQIEEMIEEMLTGYLQRIVVNVVVPPQGIAPAKGNGNDDTETFQQCIDYLAENGGGLLFVPDGDWMVKPLTIKNGVYIEGASSYTKITLIGGSPAGLLSGTVTDCGVSGLTLSNNAAQQTVDKAVIDITCNNIAMDNLVVKNGYMGVKVTVNNGALIQGIRFDTLGYGGLYVNGNNADVSVSEIMVKNVSQVSGQFGVENDCDHAVFNHITIYGPIPTGFSNTGEGVALKNAMIVNCGTGIFNVGDDCDFNALVNGNTEIINDAGERTSYNFKGQNSQRKIGENVLNLGMASPLMYRTPENKEYYATVPAMDFNSAPYNIMVENENSHKMGESPTHYMQYVYHYIDGVNGNDNNDGLTQGTAFKTVDRFLELLNTEANDIRCQIISAGTYNITKNVVSGANIHIQGAVDGITLHFAIDHNGQWYGFHYNLNNVTVTVAEGYRIYFEQSTVTLTDVVMDNDDLRFYGCNLDISGTTFKTVTFYFSKGDLSNVSVSNTDPTQNAISIARGSVIHFTAGITAAELSSPGTNNYLVNATNSVLFLETVPNSGLTNYYYYALRITNCIVVVTTSRLSSWKDRSVAKDIYNKTVPNLLIENFTELVGTDYTGKVVYDEGLKYYNGTEYVAVPTT